MADRLSTLVDFISRYFETESELDASTKCGTEMDDHHFAHSLLNIGHYLMSMGLYTSSNKVEETRVQRHMTFFACVLTHDFTAFCLVNLLIATVDPTRSEERRVG